MLKKAYYKTFKSKSGSFGHFLISMKKNSVTAHTSDLSHHCRNGEIIFVHTVYQDFRRSFWFGFNVILPNVILSFEFLVEFAATACGPSVMQYCLSVLEEAVTCYVALSLTFDLKARSEASYRLTWTRAVWFQTFMQSSVLPHRSVRSSSTGETCARRVSSPGWLCLSLERVCVCAYLYVCVNRFRCDWASVCIYIGLR